MMKNTKKAAAVTAGIAACIVPATGVSAAEADVPVQETPQDVLVTEEKVSYGQAGTIEEAQDELDQTTADLEQAARRPCRSTGRL